MKLIGIAMFAGAALSAVLPSPALADPASPVQLEELLARASNLPTTDSGPYAEGAAGDRTLMFKTSAEAGGYFCLVWEVSQAARCESIPFGNERRADSATELADDEEGSATIGRFRTVGEIERIHLDAEAATTLPDQHRITFENGTGQIECWADGPVVGCRTDREHGFALYDHSGQTW